MSSASAPRSPGSKGGDGYSIAPGSAAWPRAAQLFVGSDGERITRAPCSTGVPRGSGPIGGILKRPRRYNLRLLRVFLCRQQQHQDPRITKL